MGTIHVIEIGSDHYETSQDGVRAAWTPHPDGPHVEVVIDPSRSPLELDAPLSVVREQHPEYASLWDALTLGRRAALAPPRPKHLPKGQLSAAAQQHQAFFDTLG